MLFLGYFMAHFQSTILIKEREMYFLRLGQLQWSAVNGVAVTT